VKLDKAISTSPEAELDLAVDGLLYSYIHQIQANNQKLINQNNYLQFQLKYHLNIQSTLKKIIIENEKLKQENTYLKKQLAQVSSDRQSH
jgi:regulator of replication initiation timing